MKTCFQLFFPIWILISALSVKGQEDGAEFRVLGFGDGFFEGICFENETESEPTVVELGFYPDRRSRLYRLETRPLSLVFFSEEASKDGNLTRVELGRARWPAGADKALFVFFETSDFETAGKYEILSVDESSEKWKAGSVRFLNLSGAELELKLGDVSAVLPEDFSPIFDFDPDVWSVLPLSLRVNWQGEKRSVYSSQYRVDGNHPKLLLIKPPREEGSFRVRVLNLW
ncbi:hypothetical protein [Pelagicoccus albus]|uniref:DUF4397 domain-containing protein n=1 Tax=Pelagicoccus albus TaxID=415222 RepID=A0A7X1B4H3_9BACT|nr:hypothetical protein [Pelagicoccus albus]MBC2605387.1 hypothetical protein [Pelagicoccus albus]